LSLAVDIDIYERSLGVIDLPTEPNRIDWYLGDGARQCAGPG